MQKSCIYIKYKALVVEWSVKNKIDRTISPNLSIKAWEVLIKLIYLDPPFMYIIISLKSEFHLLHPSVPSFKKYACSYA